MEVSFYDHAAVQKRATQLIGSWEEDKLFIRLKFYESSLWHRVESDPIVEHSTKIAQRDFWVKFSHFKHQLSDNYDSNREYETLICEYLKSMGVPEDEHPAVVDNLFRVVEAAVSPVDAVVVFVWDAIYRVGDGHEPYRPNGIPASRSSIQGLEQVTLDTDTSLSCAICLEDFEQEPTTRLPCRHHFHVHCIVQCLEINHTCPLCRYPMPTEED
ncbi:putative transcription factor C2H2 family [Rosa chinensis]|uniref:RING-type E3 ubiquitin transferase n=1 Tax=Rosa chinensis TaxID=74649 RepID=A0A2P6R329_ROSCH|nr:putative transcription factor C2H2 family [Rosa chinensis]